MQPQFTSQGIVLCLLLGLALSGALFVARLYAVLAQGAKPRRRRGPAERCHLAVFLGSGGHTSEALSLLSALDFSRYSPRTYFISEGDTLSMRKALELEAAKAADASKSGLSHPAAKAPYSFVVIPRARRVHQSLLTTPVTAAVSLCAAIWHITIAPLLSRSSAPEVLLLNGPGTCFVLCIAAYLNRILGLQSPRLIYVESFARVRQLSLSGKLLRPIVDRFVVQWPKLLEDGKRGEFRGWVI